MKYAFTLTEPGQDREKIVLESRAGESVRHIALKVLAYLLFRHEVAPLTLRIEQKVGQRHKPDLVAQDPQTDAVHLWVDCGQIETERLGRIVRRNPHSRVVVVKATDGEARLYARAARKDLPDSPEKQRLVRFVGFAPEFLTGFLAPLRGANDLAFVSETALVTDDGESNSVPDKGVRLVLNGHEFSTGIYIRSAAENAEDV